MDAPAPPLALGVARSIAGRRWIWREGEARTGLAIAQRLGLDEVVARLLAARGVGIEEAQHFLEPTLRADLVRVRVHEGHPVVMQVWRGGERVA